MFVTLEQRKMLALLLLMRRRKRRLRSSSSTTTTTTTRVVVPSYKHYKPPRRYSRPPLPPRRPRPQRQQPQQQQQKEEPKEEGAAEGEEQKVEKAAEVDPKKKRLWVTPFLKARKELGEYHRELRGDEDRFVADFTLSVRQFDLLLDKISEDIYRRDTCWREAIEPAERLAICLRYLATGDSYSSISKSFRVGKSTVVGILSSVADAIWNSMAEEFMPAPTSHEWKAMADEFGQRWDFPHCVGVLDAKHVVIRAPGHSKTADSKTRKTWKANEDLVLLAVVDAGGLFRMVDVGAFGRSGGDGEGDILSASGFGRALREATLDLPDDAPIQGAEHLGAVPYVFAADEALPPQRSVLCPFPGRALHVDSQRVFNYHLSRARGVAESAFASLTSHFRVYRRVMEVSTASAEKIVRATTVLHNFLRRDQQDTAARVAPAEDSAAAEALRPVGTLGGHCASQEAISVRDKFTEYFNSPATAVAWLNDYV